MKNMESHTKEEIIIILAKTMVYKINPYYSLKKIYMMNLQYF